MKKLMFVFFVLFVAVLFVHPAESARYEEQLLSVTNIDLSQEGDTVIYRVPRIRHCVLTKAVLIVGSDAGRSVISIGQNFGDWIYEKYLFGLIESDDSIILTMAGQFPAQNVYLPRSVIALNVGTAEGGPQNKLLLYGILY